MKLPHYKYLLTLLVGKMSPQEIMKDLQANSLPVPPAKEVTNLHDNLVFEQEEYFKSNIPVDLNWLNDLGIEAMYGYKFKKQVTVSIDGIPGAFKVLNDSNMYRTISSLAMSGVTPEDIELIVNGKYDIEYSSEDLDTFLHYFFDVSKWTRYEKEEYAKNIKDTALSMFYNIALNEEKDYLMWKLGVAPNKSFDAMLRDMTVDSYYNFKEQATRNPDQAQKWGTLMLKVQERLEKVEKDLNADTDSASDLENIFTRILKKKPQQKEETSFEADVNIVGKEVPKIIKLEELN